MKHSYIWVGRKIRNSPAPIGDEARNARDDDSTCSGGCGFYHCSRTGPCAPTPPAVVPHGPPDEPLPEGWARRVIHATSGFMSRRESYEHVSGAETWRDGGEGQPWRWTPPDEPFCEDEDVKPTRAEAMAAALASVEPAEPKLHEGWHKEGEERLQRYRNAELDTLAQLTLAGSWLAIGGGTVAVGLPTLEAAMRRAEELARGDREKAG